MVDAIDRNIHGRSKGKGTSRKNTSMSDNVRMAIRKILHQELGKKPMLEVQIHEIE